MTQQLTGIFNILATPFDAAPAVHPPSLRRLVEFQLDKGVAGLTILGVLVINLTIRKELLFRRGAISHAALRPPFVGISDETYPEMDRVLQRVGIADPRNKLLLA